MASMTDESVQMAIAEAYKFITVAEQLVNRIEYYSATKSDACRKASMDLTRALAVMRSHKL